MLVVEAHQWAGVRLAAVTCLTAILRMRMHEVADWPRWAGPEEVRSALLAGGKSHRGVPNHPCSVLRPADMSLAIAPIWLDFPLVARQRRAVGQSGRDR